MKVTPETRREREIRLAKSKGNYQEKKADYIARSVKWKKANPEKVALSGKKRSLRVNYNLSWDAYEAMYKEQKGLCGICSNEVDFIGSRETHMKQASVDHCHATGKIRGLLCKHCNLGIGHFFDDTEKLEKAIKYLKDHQ